MELIFATNNSHKLYEVREKCKDDLHGRPTPIRIISLSDIGFENDIPETGTTLQENALQKARAVYDFCRRREDDLLGRPLGALASPADTFADDTGLEIEALNGEPGVYSARYAGENCSFDDNINLVLSKMQGKTNRKACFKTVIALILDGKPHFFEGRVDGEIITEKHGVEGFGYDPIFRPTGFQETFAELPLDVKNRISHRGKAIDKLVAFLSS